MVIIVIAVSIVSVVVLVPVLAAGILVSVMCKDRICRHLGGLFYPDAFVCNGRSFDMKWPCYGFFLFLLTV